MENWEALAIENMKKMSNQELFDEYMEEFRDSIDHQYDHSFSYRSNYVYYDAVEGELMSRLDSWLKEPKKEQVK